MNVIPIQVPPLRNRKGDIGPLLDHFLSIFNHKYQVKKELSEELRSGLISYTWPGNVRELANLIERLVITSHQNTISLKHLPSEYRSSFYNSHTDSLQDMSLKTAMEKVERELILKVMHRYKSTYKAAEVLGMSQSYVARRAKKYRINQD
ncbi:MAG: AAA-type ATPase lid domain-containing protein, partial [Paludibacteraceae bacterium]